MKSAQDIANFFLSHSYDGEMDDITNLKLQKLLYYAQGYSLALLGRPIFDDPICAWDHGPVVETVWRSYNQHRKSTIPSVQGYNLEGYSTDELSILNRVANDYGQYSPWRLRDMTHNETPWLDTVKNGCISLQKIKDFFMDKLTKAPPIDDRQAYNYDVKVMQRALDAERISVPDFESDEEYLAWLDA